MIFYELAVYYQGSRAWKQCLESKKKSRRLTDDTTFTGSNSCMRARVAENLHYYIISGAFDMCYVTTHACWYHESGAANTIHMGTPLNSTDDRHIYPASTIPNPKLRSTPPPCTLCALFGTNTDVDGSACTYSLYYFTVTVHLFQVRESERQNDRAWFYKFVMSHFQKHNEDQEVRAPLICVFFRQHIHGT